jgi:dihydroflavonol-4-reductase
LWTHGGSKSGINFPNPGLEVAAGFNPVDTSPAHPETVGKRNLMLGSKILVTGGTGFIGRHLVARLLHRGERVRVLARSVEKAEKLFQGEVEIVAGDLRDGTAAAAACRGCEGGYHIGGMFRFGQPYRRELWEVNVGGTRALLEGALRAGVGRFLHLSSAGLLRSAELPLREVHFPERPLWGCHYKASKHRAEVEALGFVARGLPVVVASPTCPIGWGDENPTPTGGIVRDFLQGRFPVASRTGINVMAVEDLAGGLVAAYDRGVVGERYVLGDHNLWLTEFLGVVGGVAGLPAPRVCVPWGFVLAAGVAAEIASVLARRWTHPLTLETAIHAGRVQFFDTARAREELGWQPRVKLEKAVERAVAWFEARSVRGSGEYVESGLARVNGTPII